jgi:putative ABC transport system permease protein
MLAAGLAVFIACLGLFGLSAFMAEQRTKEIGVRKTLGASVMGIVRLLSFDFIKMVVIASAIAWPIAYFAMGKWLQSFAYRDGLAWHVFVLSGVLAVFVALLSVSAQATRAALTNPVEALRYE